MNIDVQGKIIEFPDDMPKETIEAVIKEQLYSESYPKVLGKGLMQGAAFLPKAVGSGMKILERIGGGKEGLEKAQLEYQKNGEESLGNTMYRIAKEAEEYWQPQTGVSTGKRLIGETGRTLRSEEHTSELQSRL